MMAVINTSYDVLTCHPHPLSQGSGTQKKNPGKIGLAQKKTKMNVPSEFSKD